MNRSLLVLGLAATLSLPLLAGPKDAPATRLTFTDVAGDVTGDEGDEHPIDVVTLDLSSDGKSIIAAVTLAEPARPKTLFQSLMVGLAFDVDNNRKTGGQGFGAMTGDLPGIDFESEILSSFEDGAESKSSSVSVIAVDGKGNQSSVLAASDAPSTPAKGKVYTATIAYASLGVKSGQTIRIVVRELNDRGEKQGVFPEAWLTLQ